MARRLPRIVAFLISILLFIQTTLACGPFSTEAVFVFTVHPPLPLERYAKGELGVVQPSYARSYLFVAYRHLANLPLTPSEQKAVTQLWKERLGLDSELSEEGWTKSWLEARQRVPGVAAAPKVEIYRNREKPNQYENYLNCPKDAFDTAVSTLNDRVKRYGPDSWAVRTWVEGQDQVFANCSEGQYIPTELPSTADAAERADRSYQIAASNFYATNFDAAQRGFESIADDKNSPWQSSAPYLLARTFVRKASLGPDDTRADSLTRAETQLKKLLADQKFAHLQMASTRLMNLVRLKLHPTERLHEIAQTLTTGKENEHIKQDLWDYTTLLDRVLETDQQIRASANEDLTRDDLTDWISTVQGTANTSLDHSLSRWEKTHAATWLIAALSKVDGKHPKSGALISEALSVKTTSPAFASARFHAVRLMIESGKTTEARTLLDQTLKSNRAQFDPSSLNLLSTDRMMVAPTLADFLSHVPRIPAALSWNDDGREIPIDPAEVSAEEKALIGKLLYDFDGAKALNTQIPLSVLKESVKDQSLPKNLRQDLAQAVWMRAVLLGDFKAADELVPGLKILFPALTTNLDVFVGTAEPDAKRFSALFTWLKFPGIEPIVDAGFGRQSAINEQDSYRDNWWCSAVYPSPSETKVTDPDGNEIQSFTTSALSSPLFLDATQRAAAAKEWTTLRSLGATPNYLTKQVIQWATRNPADNRVPEALHLAVNSTRYGCTDKDSGRWSKTAFDLLHRKYPNTTWAKKTKYWFKE